MLKRFIGGLCAAVALLASGPVSAQYVVKAGQAYTIALPDVVASSDHISGLTGQTGTVYLSRVAGSTGTVTKAASTNSITQIDAANSPGQYTLTLTSTETGTAGYIKGYYKSGSSDPVSFTIKVVGYDPDDASLLGLSGVATASAQATAATAQTTAQTAVTAIKAQTDKFLFDGSNYVKANLYGNSLTTLLSSTDLGNIWANASRTLTGFAFTPNVGNVGGTLPNVTVGGYATGQDPATLVYGATSASFNASNTFGYLFNHITGGGGSDPWSTALPGSYASGTAGYLLSHMGSASDPWATSTGSYASGTFGYYLTHTPGWYTAPPLASDFVTALKADAQWKQLVSHAAGKYTYNPTTHVLSLYDTDGTTVLKTLTLTLDGSGNITNRQ